MKFVFDSHGKSSKLNARTGQTVEVLWAWVTDEADADNVSDSFHIRFEDGFETDAYADELTLSEYEPMDEIKTLAERDAELEELWSAFDDAPMEPETECIEAAFLGFPVGTDRKEIWRWFDQRHSKGVAYLLYGGTEDYATEARRLYGLKELCTECDSENCVFNPKGVCLAPFVTGKAPRLYDEGCLDFCYKEEI